MKKYLCIIGVFLTANLSYGQDISAANKKLKDGFYYAALKTYEESYAKDSLNKDLNFKMGVCNFHLKNYSKAEAHFLKSSSAVSLELFRYKAAIAHAKMKFKKAINFYNAYKLIAGKKDITNDEVNHMIEKVKFAELAIQNKRNVFVQPSDKLNTQYQESNPRIIADGSMLLFTSQRGEVLNSQTVLPFTQIYSSEKVNNAFTDAKPLNSNINTGAGDQLIGLSTDGQTMFILRNNDIYEAKMGLDDWEEPVRLSDNINSKYNESGITITLDDKVMYFVSDRPGGQGGKDIYKSLRLPNGKWSKALNLGPTVNTPYDEEAPFIHSDKKTLYFSSKGHQNMGGYDIFKTTLEKRVWSDPESLKYPINTVDDDLYYSVTASGKVAYYSSYKKEGNGSDIYKVLLKDEFLQFHVIKAVVKGTKSSPIPAKITLIENESKKVHGIYNSNSKTGKFIMLVDPEKTYNIIVEAPSYHSYTSKLVVDVNNKERVEYQLDAK